MGTEVLHPQDCFINVNIPPVIIRKNGNSYRNNNNGYKKPQPIRSLLPEKTGSTSRRERELKPNNCIINDDDSYAGSAFYHSPSPRSLPLPSFFTKKQDTLTIVADHGGFDDSATKHLCHLLRLG